MNDGSSAIRVLHVDDDPDITELTSVFLERENDRFTVQTTTNASDGLDELAEGDVDCIVSDYDMPGTNGIEFLRTVRERRPDLPFILYTGKGSEEIASKAISAGVTDYLQKESGTDHYTVLANRIENAVESYRTERALQATRRRYEKVVEQNLAGIYIIQHGEFVYVNPKLAEIHGYDRNTIIGMSPLELVAPEERDRVEENLRKRLDGEVEDIQYQTVGLTKDGEHIDIELHGSHIEYRGEPAVIGAELDISERKERERELERYEAIVENSEEGIYVFDEDGRFKFVNERVTVVADIPREEWFDSHVSLLANLQILSEEEVTAVEHGVRSVANEEDSEVRFTLHPDVPGDIRHLELRLTPLRSADGTSRVIGFSRDVTDRVERQRELERMEERNEQIIERVTDAIVEVDANWRFTLVNEQAEDLYDMSAEDLLGRDVWDVFGDDKDTRFEKEFREVMETREPTSFVEYSVQLDGWFDIEAYPKDDGGIAFYFLEVTEQRERQQELEQTNALLSTLFETLPVGVLAEDDSRDVLAVNERLFDLFEFPGAPEDVIGADCEEMAGQVSEMFADPDGFVERINDLVANREPTGNEELQLSDGRTFARSYRPIDLPTGEGHLWTYRDISDSKERERRHNAIFNHTFQFTGLLEPDGTLIEANETALEFAGLDRDDVLGKKMWEAFWFQHSRETSTRAREAVERAASGEFVRLELPVQGATDEVIIDFSVRPLTDDQGNVTLLIPEGRDITELKDQERELRETKRRLDLVLEGTETGIWEWNMETDDVEWNETLERAFGLDPSSFEGTYEAFATRVHPDDLPEVEAAIERAIETNEPYHAEFRMVHEDGHTVWAEAQGLKISEDSEPDRMVGLFRDITERKEREVDLERYKTLIEATGDPVYTLDEDGNITYVNEAVLDLSGYGDDELIGAHATKIMSKEHFGRGTDLIQSLLSSDQDRGTFEMEFVTANGEHIPCEIHVALLPSEHDFRGTIGVIRDISDRVEREQQLERERDRLDEFSSLVSHDLRNPLNVAEGRLELARDECDSDHLDAIARAVERMNVLIEDLLTLAREGETVGDTEPIDLRRLTESCWDNVATTEATFATDIDRRIHADRSRLQQLLENLMRNAVEHGGEDVTITVGELEDGFYVEDDGPGIPEDERDDVFDPGYTTTEDGTGFGLSIAKQVAQAHGWDIRVTEGDYGGARFVITGVAFAE